MHLEHVWEQATDLAEASGLPIFPGTPAFDRLAVAIWDGDPAEFIRDAKEAGARILYIEQLRLDGYEIERAARGFPSAPGGEAAQLLADLRSRVGELTSVSLGWVIDGVLHVWGRPAPWRDQLLDRLEELAEGATEAWQSDLEGRLRSDARMVAHDERYAACCNDGQRKRLVEELGLGYTLLSHRWQEFLTEVKTVYDDEVRPVRERSLADEARQAIAAGSSKKHVALAVGVGVDRLDRLLATYPASSADPRDSSLRT